MPWWGDSVWMCTLYKGCLPDITSWADNTAHNKARNKPQMINECIMVRKLVKAKHINQTHSLLWSHHTLHILPSIPVPLSWASWIMILSLTLNPLSFHCVALDAGILMLPTHLSSFGESCSFRKMRMCGDIRPAVRRWQMKRRGERNSGVAWDSQCKD